MNLRFAYLPLLLLLIPVGGFLAWRLLSRPSSVALPSAARIAEFANPISKWRARLPLFMRTAILALLVLAAARPQSYSYSREVSDSGVDIMLCIDTSGSMNGLDFNIDGRPVERLTAVKKVLQEFVKKRAYDRMGMVVFGRQAYTQAPLTLDKGLLLSLVDRLEVGMAGGDRTAIGDALALAGKRIKAVSAPTKIVILLTDGAQNAGSIEARDAASALAALGIKIYTIGVGTNGPVPFRLSLFSDQVVYQPVAFDEQLLKDVAAIGNGKYYFAGDTETLRNIYKEIDKAEKSEVKIKEFFSYHELFPIFLIPALILALLEILAVSRRALP